MAVTPNYGWPVPVATDLVKDGYEAIADLGDAIDATVYGLPAGGLTLINATTMTAANTVTIDNVFSATHKNYLLQISTTVSDITSLQLRVGGVTTAGVDYHSNGFGANGAGSSSVVNNGQATSNWLMRNTATAYYALTIFNPFLASKTAFNGTFMATGATFNTQGTFGGVQGGATSFDGIQINATTAVTGLVKIYGYGG